MKELRLPFMKCRRPEEGWILNSRELFRAVQEGAHLFQGVTDATMSHGEGWQYIRLGRYVERTNTLAALMGTHFKRAAPPTDLPVDSGEYLSWVGLLRGCAAFEAYCKAQTAEIRPLRVAEGDYWEMLLPSQYAQPTELLAELCAELKLERRGLPLELLMELNQALYDKFDYAPNITRVDSPIDDALRAPRGLPGFRAHHDCAGAPVENSVPLRQRLFISWRQGEGFTLPWAAITQTFRRHVGYTKVTRKAN
jgi:hypothetical protein